MTANFVAYPRTHNESVYGVGFTFKDLVKDECTIKADPANTTVRELVEHAEFFMDTANDTSGTKVDHIHFSCGTLTQEEEGLLYCSEIFHIDIFFVEQDNLWDSPFKEVAEKLCFHGEPLRENEIIGDASFDQYHGN